MPELGSVSVSFKQGHQLMEQYQPPVRGGGEGGSFPLSFSGNPHVDTARGVLW